MESNFSIYKQVEELVCFKETHQWGNINFCSTTKRNTKIHQKFKKNSCPVYLVGCCRAVYDGQLQYCNNTYCVSSSGTVSWARHGTSQWVSCLLARLLEQPRGYRVVQYGYAGLEPGVMAKRAAERSRTLFVSRKAVVTEAASRGTCQRVESC
jgi:hypothetical protein